MIFMNHSHRSRESQAVIVAYPECVLCQIQMMGLLLPVALTLWSFLAATDAYRFAGSQGMKNVETVAELQTDAATAEGLPGPDLEEWMALLDSPKKLARLDAAQAIGKMGKKAAAAIPQLIDRLDDTERKDVRIAAAEALGNMGGLAANSVTAMFNVLGQDITSPEDRYLKAASVALGKIGKEESYAVIKVVRERMGYHAWFIKWLAVTACGRMGEKAANMASKLREMSYDEDVRVRDAAKHALDLIDKDMS
eukprot:s4091_g2.t1